MRHGVADRVLHHPCRPAAGAPEAHVDDLCAVVQCVANAPRQHVVGADLGTVEDVVPVAVEHLHRHDVDVVGEPRNADAVVGELSDRPAHVRAVAVQIERQAVIPDEVVRRDELRRAELRCDSAGTSTTPRGRIYQPPGVS